MKPAPFDYQRARSVEHALELFGQAAGTAKYLAGGQSLGPAVNLRFTQVDTLIDLSRIEALQRVEETATIRIGAAVRHAEIEDGLVADASCGLMQRAAATLAYRSVRNRGTLGGSLAHADPVAEWPSVMLALDAAMHVTGGRGSRRVAVAEFLVGHLTTALADDEILTAIELPRLPRGTRTGYQKFCRKSGEFAEALAVVVLPPGGAARVVLGCVAGTPVPMPAVAAVAGSADGWRPGLDAELRQAAAADLAGLGVTLDDYEINLHAVIAMRAVREALA